MAMGFYFKSLEHTTTQHSADNFFLKSWFNQFNRPFYENGQKKCAVVLAIQVTFLAKFWSYMGELE